jgi:hypothetical protein
VGRSPLFLLEDAVLQQSPDALRVSLNRLKAAVLGTPLHQRLADTVVSRRSIPMLFPHWDLGLCYPPGPAVLSSPLSFQPAARRRGDELHVPCGEAGGRAPHVWLRRAGSGEQASTLDVVSRLAASQAKGAPRWVLLIAAEEEEGGAGSLEAWGRVLLEWEGAEAGVEGRVCMVAVLPCAAAGGEDQRRGERAREGERWVDSEGKWAALCGLEAGGAVLVRPDGHIAWRSATPCGDSRRGGVVEELVALGRRVM